MRPNSEFINDFVEEALLHIATVEDALLKVETGNYAEETVNEIFRAVHSIKGAAGLFNFVRIAELAHAAETLFGAIRDKTVSLNSPIVDAVLAVADLLKEMIGCLETSDTYDINAQVQRLKTFLPAPQGSVEENKNLWGLGDTIASDKKPAEICNETKDNPDRENNRAKVEKEKSIRVGVGVFDDLLVLAGEMVLRRNQLMCLVGMGVTRTEELQMVAKDIDLVTTALQEKVLKARMQPVANLFNKFHRIVRDLSRKLGKEIELRIEGDQVELDKSTIEALGDPLIHIVRNAIDHGIEPTNIREERKKPYIAHVTIRAYHEAGKVTIDVEDDGVGIDPGKIAAKALERGLVTEQQLTAMNESEIIYLIMRPGFSTVDEVTALSGRGVGMDIVKNNIEKLGGKVELLSSVGYGSIVRLVLPLTLAIIPAVIVQSADFTAAIPQANLQELVLLQPDDEKRSIELVMGYPVLRLRERLFPLLRLTDIIGDTRLGIDTGSAEYFCDPEKIFQIVVLNFGNRIFALEVDKVYDHEEILVKPLPPTLIKSNYYMGFAVLGDGRIAFILNPEEIRNHVGLRPLATEAAVDSIRGSQLPEEEQSLLLFSTAGGETIGIDITLVSRVETHEAAAIQRIRSKEYVISRGKPLRIIRPEYYLPVASPKDGSDSIHLIIPKLVKQSVGIVARGIGEIVKTAVALNEEGPGGCGLIGSTLINDRIVLLLNIYELLEQALPETCKVSTSVIRKQEKSPLAPTAARVLLVEDRAFFSKVTKGYLESAGMEVKLAADGREALDILEQDEVDLVISDIEMPVMNGYELIRAIRANERLRKLPAIALTSLLGEANKEKGLRSGFDAYEYKLDRDRLLKTAQRFLGRSE